MLIQNKNSRLNIGLHIALQIVVCFSFMLGIDFASIKLFNAFVPHIFFYISIIALSIALYMFIYKKYEPKLRIAYLIWGILFSALSLLGAFALFVGFDNPIPYLDFYKHFIYFNIPIALYILSFFSKKVFMGLFVLLLILTIIGLPMLPMSIAFIIEEPLYLKAIFAI